MAPLLLAATPSFAQVDISGVWGSRLHEDLAHRSAGAETGDYTGLPLNIAGRRKADTWNAAILSSPEEQTKPHPAQYSMRGPGTNLRITQILRPYDQKVLAYTIEGLYGRADRTIWMDGRPHPSDHALHTWAGFSTGVVVDNKLVVTTTHMKAAFINRNGAPASYRSKMTEYFVRHGDMLTLTTIISDPVYLDEPFIRTSTWVLTPNAGVDNRMAFEVVDEVANRPRDFVPSFPLGTRHDDFAKTMGLPYEATEGGAATLYPEYIPVLERMIKGEPGGAPPPRPLSITTPAALPVDPDVETIELRPGLFMLVVDGVNVTVQTGKDGVLIVDAGRAAGGEKLLRAVRQLSQEPIRYLIDTHFHDEATGANAAIVTAGGPRDTASAAGPVIRGITSGVQVLAQENTNVRLSEAGVSNDRLPTSTFYTERKDAYFNGEAVVLLSEPAAHTDSDILVFFRKSDVVSVGGVLDTTRYPVLDTAAGGSLAGEIKALTAIIDITVPERNQMGGTLVVPGVGRICDESDVVEYRDMLITLRDRIRNLIGKGMTLAQIKAAQPLLEYDGIYGAKDGPWTSDMFLEAVYRELSAKKGK